MTQVVCVVTQALAAQKRLRKENNGARKNLIAFHGDVACSVIFVAPFVARPTM